MKVFAFYLPQFYRTPINDKWWGEGFTEWTSARKARSLFDGHYQPHEPMDEYYYNLLDKGTMLWQASLMNKYGIDGMCFYHYWFSSEEVILEKPAENLLMWKEIKMPFFFSWANESWLNKWSQREGFTWVDNNNQQSKKLKYIFFQKYGREEEWEKHFYYLLEFFKDERYVKIQGKPVFIIHNIYNIPCIYEMIHYWNKLANENGFEGIYFIGGGLQDVNCEIDAYMTHEPGMIRACLNCIDDSKPNRFSYVDAGREILKQRRYSDKTMIYTTFCSYDTSPRYGYDGDIYIDATPNVFEEHLAHLMAKNMSSGVDMVFIDAWNEWGEGMHLEPDKRFGMAWLEAVSNAKKSYHKYLDVYDDARLSVSDYRNLCDKKKAEINGAILDRWMKLRENGFSILDYLKEHNIVKILVYGLGMLSNHFVWECKGKIDVVGAIDRSDHYSLEGIQTYKINSEIPVADAIIITAVYYSDRICEEIRKYNDKIKIFSLYELILFAEEKMINAEENEI